VLVDTGLVASTDSDYGAVYYLTERAESHWESIVDIIDQVSQ